MTVIFCLFLSASGIFAQQIYEIDEVKFRHTDKKTFDEGQLEDAVAITKSEIYNQKLIAGDILKLQRFYFDNGFFDATVDTSVSINYEDEEAIVTFTVTENKRYKIDSISIRGISKVTQETLAKVKKIKTIKRGDNYSRVLIIQHSSEILDTLQNNGYMNASLNLDSGTVIRRNKGTGLVSVEIGLTGADTVFYFGSTSITVKDNVYGLDKKLPREEIVYKEGEVYSKAKKLESERNIARIPIISSAKINPDAISGERVNFNVNILLNKKYELTPYVKESNFENRFYVGGGVKFLDKHFLSGNRTLLLELEEDFNSYHINQTQLSATFTQPHFIAKKITFTDRLSVGLNNADSYRNYFVTNLSTLNYFIAEHTFYNNAYLDLSEEFIWLSYDTMTTGSQTQFNSFLSITLEHDNTNILFSPSRGFYHSILVGSSGLLPRAMSSILGKNIYYSQFFKAYTLNKLYFSLTKNATSVLATCLKIGDIIEYGSGENLIPVQPFYKFYSGGSNSVRGWKAQENGILDDTFEGGNFLFEGSFELRQKLFPRAEGFKKNIGAAFFLDYGNVWETQKDFRFSEIAYAIGFGVRYDLFIGPIRFDFGFKLYDPAAPEGNKWLFEKFTFKDKFALQFGIGQAF